MVDIGELVVNTSGGTLEYQNYVCTQLRSVVPDTIVKLKDTNVAGDPTHLIIKPRGLNDYGNAVVVDLLFTGNDIVYWGLGANGAGNIGATNGIQAFCYCNNNCNLPSGQQIIGG